jgi:hypothetical protein
MEVPDFSYHLPPTPVYYTILPVSTADFDSFHLRCLFRHSKNIIRLVSTNTAGKLETP